jgi:hypothetical protein
MAGPQTSRRLKEVAEKTVGGKRRKPDKMTAVVVMSTVHQADCGRPRSSPQNLCDSSFGSGGRPPAVARGLMTSHVALQIAHGNVVAPSGIPLYPQLPAFESGFIFERSLTLL